MNICIKQIRKYLTPAVFIILVSSCAAFQAPMTNVNDSRTYTLTEDEKRDVKCKVIFTSGLNEQKIPIDNLTEYNLDSGNQLYLFVRFFNLYRSEYFVCVNLYSEDGKLFDQYNSVLKPTKMSCDIYFLGQYFSSIVKTGNIKMEVKINNIKVDESVLLFKKTNL